MGTTVTGFMVGCLAGGIVTICGTGSGGDIGDRPPHVVVCHPGDVLCQVFASATATRACQIMPSRRIAYGRPWASGEIQADLAERGLIASGEWLEGEDCEP